MTDTLDKLRKLVDRLSVENKALRLPIPEPRAGYVRHFVQVESGRMAELRDLRRVVSAQRLELSRLHRIRDWSEAEKLLRARIRDMEDQYEQPRGTPDKILAFVGNKIRGY